jgi:flagella synthesis protein FlgN
VACAFQHPQKLWMVFWLNHEVTMSINPALVQQMIAQDMNATEQLKSLLLQERELLEKREHDGLPAIIDQKDQLLDALAQNARQRQQLLQNLGLKATAQSWEELLVAHTALSPLRDSWKALTQAFGECQRLNEVNGKMIARSKQTLGNLLNILRGQVAAPQLYTQSGSTTGNVSSHTLAKA